jgi:beta-phosphoglucomutase-like phosphatase (HAD superfamily)
MRACLFDLHGVLTQTAAVHAAGWKEMFDAYLRERSKRTGELFKAFERVTDYDTVVDGKPRADGSRSFLHSRGIVLPEGNADDEPEAETVHGLGNRKNGIVLRRLRAAGVTVFPGSLRYVRATGAARLRRAVVSSSTNAHAVLVAAGIIDDLAACIIVERDGLKGKPRRGTYLAAAPVLDVAPAPAAVCEDALAGVEAGRAGGFGFVVGVDRAGGCDAFRELGTVIVVNDLADRLDQP